MVTHGNDDETMRMKIDISDKHDPAVFDALVAGVRAYNHENLGHEVSKPLVVTVRNENGELTGGVAGRTIYRQFLIEVVWVDQACRRTGLGRHLMERAEAEARQRGCAAAQVDTLSFQGPVFYGKLGFEVAGKVSGVPDSPDRYFMFKIYR